VICFQTWILPQHVQEEMMLEDLGALQKMLTVVIRDAVFVLVNTRIQRFE